MPVLAIGGAESPARIQAAARAVATAVSRASHLTLEGQDHGVLHRPEALRPALTGFFA